MEKENQPQVSITEKKARDRFLKAVSLGLKGAALLFLAHYMDGTNVSQNTQEMALAVDAARVVAVGFAVLATTYTSLGITDLQAARELRKSDKI